MQDIGAPRNEIKTRGRSPLSGSVDRGRPLTAQAETTTRPKAVGRMENGQGGRGGGRGGSTTS
eukprot:662032-Pyramimonas_sp.AAC.1